MRNGKRFIITMITVLTVLVITLGLASRGKITTSAAEPNTAIVNAKDYGAKGDGVTDDTDAIQRAVNYLATKGGCILLPGNSTYLVRGQILLPSNITIKGEGANCIIKIDPATWNGGINRFYTVFSTVNVTQRPQEILWRIGTGAITYRNINIENIQFELNRDSNALTGLQMNVADFNAIRFEDAENCTVKNCRFIDKQSPGQASDMKNNGTALVFFIRSSKCSITDSYAYKCKLLEILESKDCEAIGNTLDTVVTTGIETAYGDHQIIKGNRFINGQYWATSTLGVNCPDSVVEDNYIEKASITGIHFGETTAFNANSYNLPAVGDNSICQNNRIVSGDSTVPGCGKRGIFVLNGKNVIIKNNTINNLIADPADPENSFVGGIILNLADGAIVEGNTVDGGHWGVASYGSMAASITVKGNYLINNTYGGITSHTNPCKLNMDGNVIINTKYGVVVYNAELTCINNHFEALTEGLRISSEKAVVFNYNKLINVINSGDTAILMSGINSLTLLGNKFLKDTVSGKTIFLYNCHKLTMKNIKSEDNDFSGYAGPIYINPGTANFPAGAKISTTASK